MTIVFPLQLYQIERNITRTHNKSEAPFTDKITNQKSKSESHQPYLTSTLELQKENKF